MSTVITTDGKQFPSAGFKLVGSVSAVRSRDVNKPARVGEFPVFVEQSGSYRLFTYTKRIQLIWDEA